MSRAQLLLKESNNNFVKIRCSCKNEQICFSRPTTEVKCLVCDKTLAKPTGGKAEYVGRVLEELQ